MNLNNQEYIFILSGIWDCALISTDPSTTSIKANPAEVLQRSDDLKRETPVSGSDLGGVVYQLWWASIVKIVVHICHAFFSKIVLTELRAKPLWFIENPHSRMYKEATFWLFYGTLYGFIEPRSNDSVDFSRLHSFSHLHNIIPDIYSLTFNGFNWNYIYSHPYNFKQSVNVQKMQLRRKRMQIIWVHLIKE